MRLRVESDWILTLILFYICQFTFIWGITRYAFYWINLEFKFTKFSQWTQTLERVQCILCISNGLSEEFQCPCVRKGIAGSPWSHAEADSGQRPPSAHLTYLLVPVQLCWWWGWRGWCAADPLLDKRACRFGETDSSKKLSLSGITRKTYPICILTKQPKAKPKSFSMQSGKWGQITKIKVSKETT